MNITDLIDLREQLESYLDKVNEYECQLCEMITICDLKGECGYTEEDIAEIQKFITCMIGD